MKIKSFEVGQQELFGYSLNAGLANLSLRALTMNVVNKPNNNRQL